MSRQFAGEHAGESLDGGPGADPEAVARAICLRLLTTAPRSRSELAQAMRRRNVPEEAADEVLSRFSEVGLIDDRAFARAWVASRHRGRGLARRALAQELGRRGIDREVLDDALAEVTDEDELVAARALVARRMQGTRGLSTEARIRRLTAMLARKGYPAGVARTVVRDALQAEADSTDEAAESGDLLDQLLADG